jgi:hypothetical protein
LSQNSERRIFSEGWSRILTKEIGMESMMEVAVAEEALFVLLFENFFMERSSSGSDEFD